MSINAGTFDKIPVYVRRYFSAGNQVQPLFGADCEDPPAQDIFVRATAAVQGARSCVQLEMYEIDMPEMVDLLVADAKRGIRVQVITDPPGDDAFDAARKAAMDRLRAGGVDVRLHPEPPVAEGKKPLDHMKMLVVDGAQSLIGGMNWGAHSPANHDFDVMVTGPAVADMSRLFREDWLASGGTLDALPPISTPPADGDAYVNLVVSSEAPEEQTLGKTVMRAIRNAKSIHVEMFALTDGPVLEALIDARKRGADVKVIVDPLQIGDGKTNEHSVARLRAAGVPVKWYVCNPKSQEMLHAKIGIFDDDQVLLGSANWSEFGFSANREADVEVLSREVNRSFERQFEVDWATRTADAPTYLPDPNAPVQLPLPLGVSNPAGGSAREAERGMHAVMA